MSDRLDDLISAWLDDSISDDDCRALEALLATSDQARRRYVRSCRLHATLAAGHAAHQHDDAIRWRIPAMAAAALVAVTLGVLTVAGQPGAAGNDPAAASGGERRITVNVSQGDHPLPNLRFEHLTNQRDHHIRL